jgi:peptide/nickel transport system ATP-binding protein/oligopeptide transport system ATP-binding protein
MASAETGDLLEVEDLAKHFKLPGGPWQSRRVLRAVDDISFNMKDGETLGVVGESGSGKSTLGRLIVGLTRPSSGRIAFGGKVITGARGSSLRKIREDIQVVFQDPYVSLDPRMAVEDAIAEPLRAHGRYGRRTGMRRVHYLLERVGISPAHGTRLPREFSGGQCQRIGIARALALQPKLIILDEPVSALDVSVQAQVLNLLNDLQDEFGMAYIFISHDLSVVRHVAHRVAVMYLGKIVEEGPTETVFGSPMHPYTRALISAIPNVDVEARRERVVLVGDLPSPIAPPSGCSFRTRCWKAEPDCADNAPKLEYIQSLDRAVACWYPLGEDDRDEAPG